MTLTTADTGVLSATDLSALLALFQGADAPTLAVNEDRVLGVVLSGQDTLSLALQEALEVAATLTGQDTLRALLTDTQALYALFEAVDALGLSADELASAPLTVFVAQDALVLQVDGETVLVWHGLTPGVMIETPPGIMTPGNPIMVETNGDGIMRETLYQPMQDVPSTMGT